MLNRFRVHLAYALGGVANSFALFLLIPYLVVRLTPAEYGNWNLFEITILLITMIGGAGLDVGLIRAYWGEDADPPRPLIGTVLIGGAVWGVILMALGGAAALLFHSTPAVMRLFPDAYARDALLMVVATGVLEGWFNLLIAILRVREQAYTYVTVTFGRMLLFLALAIWGVESGGGLFGALNGRMTAALVGVVGALLIVMPHFDWQWRRAMWGRVVRYGLPLLPTNLAIYTLFSADRYALTAFASTQTVGVYSFVYKLGTILDILIIRPFSLDWAQRRYIVAKRADAPRAFGQIALFFLWATLSFALVIFAGSRAVYALVAQPIYEEALPLVPLILLGFVAYGLSYPLNIGMILKDRTQWLPPLSWVSALACILFTLWWVPQAGMAGAAWANLVAYTLFTLAFAVASQRLYPIQYPWMEIGKVALAACLAGGGVYAVDAWMPEAIWLGTAAKVAWVLALMLLVGWLTFGSWLPRKRPSFMLEKAER